jgi:hypothetical protein
VTAEIALMNKTAVALAADSAVTIESGTGLKVFRTVNKLFTLSKYHPVGVMIFGGASLNGVPWETIVKAYRQELRDQELSTIDEYARHFFEYLDGARNLFPGDQQVRTFSLVLEREINEIRRDIDERVRQQFETAGAVGTDEIKAIVSNTIKDHHDRWTGAEELPDLPQGYADSVKQAYRDAAKQIYGKVLEKLPLTAADKRRLEALPALFVTRDVFNDSPSGVVVAGFGQDQLMPSLVGYSVDYVVENRVKRSLHQETEITHTNPAVMTPFAQSEMVSTFMEGFDPQLRAIVEQYVRQLLENASGVVLGHVGSTASSVPINTLEADLKKLVQTAAESFEGVMSELGRRHAQPIIYTVAVLPKDELAAMAEAMVNLTSFKRKVSLDEVETVGGEIDVAVISRGDGFVWIKRKHYFDLDRNPLWLQNYYR